MPLLNLQIEMIHDYLLILVGLGQINCFNTIIYHLASLCVEILPPILEKNRGRLLAIPCHLTIVLVGATSVEVVCREELGCILSHPVMNRDHDHDHNEDSDEYQKGTEDDATGIDGAAQQYAQEQVTVRAIVQSCE